MANLIPSDYRVTVVIDNGSLINIGLMVYSVLILYHLFGKK